MNDKASPGEEESSFRVTDRRRVGREETNDASPAGRPAGAGPSEEPGRQTAEAPRPDKEEAAPKEVRLLPVVDVVLLLIGELHALAWLHMGLTANPETGLVAKDLPQAQLAIDCIAGLIESLGSAVPKPERDDLERLLADLRLNFVRQSAP